VSAGVPLLAVKARPHGYLAFADVRDVLVLVLVLFGGRVGVSVRLKGHTEGRRNRVGVRVDARGEDLLGAGRAATGGSDGALLRRVNQVGGVGGACLGSRGEGPRAGTRAGRTILWGGTQMESGILGPRDDIVDGVI